MDPPRIQYAKTKDDVNIAFWTIGQGPALVIPPTLVGSHIRLEWEIGVMATDYERLSRGAMVIRYDGRGTGMSQRDRIDFSLEARLLDFTAVLDRLELEEACLFDHGMPNLGLAVALASQRPRRVSRLVLYSRVGDGTPDYASFVPLLRPVAETHWHAFTETCARLINGWESPRALDLARLIRATHTPESFFAGQDLFNRHLRPQFEPGCDIQALILYALGASSAEQRAGSIASQLRNAQVFGFAGDTPGPLPNSIGIDAILAFLSADAEDRLTESLAGGSGAFRTILFTDLENHTQMMQRLGDDRGRALLREHERLTREALAAHGGTEVKTMGDGFMASFGSAQKALECAIALQQSFEQTDIVGAHGRAPLRIRIGVNAGEPIAEEDDLFGSSVIIAARTAAKAQGGEVLVTDVVRQLVAGKGFSFADRGESELRGFEEPVRLWELRWS